MSTITEQTIIEKVKAILDRANHPNTPQAEAETALSLAQKLITKYNLDESALSKAQAVTEDIERDFLLITGKYALKRLLVASSVASANSCSSYRSTHYDKKEYDYTYNDDGVQRTKSAVLHTKNGFELHIFGTAKDIFATKVLWQAIETLGLRTLPKGDTAFRHSWWIGFHTGIANVLQRSTDEVVAETGGNSLVLVERWKRANTEMRASVKLRSTGYSTGASRSDAYNKGRSAGESFSTNGVSRGAIGALNA